MKALVSPELWDDDVVRAMPPDEKLAFIWLLTNSKRSILGVTQISERKFSEETGLQPEALWRALEHHEGLRRASGAVWVRAWIKWQFGRGRILLRNNLCKTILKALEELHIDELVDAVLESYPELSKPYLDWRASLGHEALRSPPKPSEGLSRARNPSGGGREGEGEGEGEGGAGGTAVDTPTKQDWDAASNLAGLPPHVAEYEWNKLGSRAFSVTGVEGGPRLRRAGMAYYIANLIGRWRRDGCPSTWPVVVSRVNGSAHAAVGLDEMRNRRGELQAQIDGGRMTPDALRAAREEIRKLNEVLLA